MTDIKDVLGPELYRQVELMLEKGGHGIGNWNGDVAYFVKAAVKSYLSGLRPDYVGMPPRKLEVWEPYPYDPDNPEHVALYKADGRFEV